MNLVLTPQTLISPVLANNLLGEFANFNKPYTYVVTSGTGIATNQSIGNNKLFGYLTMGATPTSTSLLKWKAIGSEFEKTITETGYYVLSFWIYKNNANASLYYNVEVFTNGNLYETLEFTADSSFQNGKWNLVSQNIHLNAGDVIDFRFSTQTDIPSTNIQIDGFKLEKNNVNQGLPTIYVEGVTEIAEENLISIPSIAINGSYKVVLALPGVLWAEINGYVVMRYSDNIIDNDILVGYPCVTADNEVTVMLHNLSGGATPVITDATFYLKLIK